MGHVQTELKADVLRITIDRPEKKNALTNAMYTALADAVEQGEANPDVRVMLLHGNGDSFTAGNDLEDFVANPWKGQTVPPALRFIAAVVGAKKADRRGDSRNGGGHRRHHPAALRLGLCRGQCQVGYAVRQSRDRAGGRFDRAVAGVDGTSTGGGIADAGGAGHARNALTSWG